MARPKMQWSPDQQATFEELCSIFCTKAEVCRVLGIDRKTLDRLIAENYPDTPTWAEAFELLSGTGKVSLRRKLFELAVDGDKTALIFMAKNYLGMSDVGTTGESAEARPEGRLVKFDQSRYANRVG